MLRGGVQPNSNVIVEEAPVIVQDLEEYRALEGEDASQEEVTGVVTVKDLKGFQEAIGNVNNKNATVQLEADIDLTANNDSYGAIARGEVRLDLNGHTITAKEDNYTHVLAIVEGATLYLSDSKGGGKITASTADGGYGIINSWGNIVVESGSIETAGFSVTLYENAKIEVTGGIVKSTGSIAISLHGTEPKSHAMITGGEVASPKDYAIYSASPESTVDISGGKVTGGAGCVMMNAGTLTITDGTLESDGTGDPGSRETDTVNGSAGAAKAVINLKHLHKPVTANISGGTFIQKENKNPIYLVGNASGANAEDSALSVTGGTYTNGTIPVELARVFQKVTKRENGYDVPEADDSHIAEGYLYRDGQITRDVKELTIATTSANVTAGQTVDLTKYFTLKDADGNAVSDVGAAYASLDEKILTVSPNGTATGVAAGTAKVAVSPLDPQKDGYAWETAEITVYVASRPIPTIVTPEASLTPEPSVSPEPTPDTPTGTPAPTPGTTTETTVKDDGTKVTTTTTINEDGSKKQEVTEEKPDGSKVESTTITNTDGSSQATKTETAADGTVTKTTKTDTAADGSATKTENTTETNSKGTQVAKTVVTKNDTTGNVTGVTEKSVFAPVNNTEATVTVTKDGSNHVTAAKASIVNTTSGSKVILSADIAEQVAEAAGQENVVITLTAKKANGDVAYQMTVNASDVKSGEDLYVYAYNKKTKEYTLVNAKTYAIKNTNLSISLKNNKANEIYRLVNNKRSTTLTNKILKTVKLAKTSVSVKKGKKTNLAFSSKLNTANVKKITYSTSKKAVAAVNKNGKITAKKKGAATVKAKVTLLNGKTKTVKMKVRVK